MNDLSVSQRLHGVWSLSASYAQRDDGTIIHPFGTAPLGRLIYAEDKMYSAQVFRNDRPRFETGDQNKGTVDEVMAAFAGAVSYFGRYELNVEESYLVHHVSGSLFPNWEGEVQKRFFEFDGDLLVLKTPPIEWDGVNIVGVVSWQRHR